MEDTIVKFVLSMNEFGKLDTQMIHPSLNFTSAHYVWSS